MNGTPSPTRSGPPSGEPALETRNLTLHYGREVALSNVSLQVRPQIVTALIGPSGCGKSSLLRCFNRMNDLIANTRVEGQVLVGGYDVNGPDVDVIQLRKQVGMVFQRSNPFPKSVFDNIAFALRLHGIRRRTLEEVVERSLRDAALWDEVKDRLHSHALALSGGQQQRLCIARAIAIQPKVILMDEPASALDPLATARIEELILELKRHYTIVIVTHNMQQAARISDRTAFFYLGKLVEEAATNVIFTHPERRETEAYVTGRFG